MALLCSTGETSVDVQIPRGCLHLTMIVAVCSGCFDFWLVNVMSVVHNGVSMLVVYLELTGHFMRVDMWTNLQWRTALLCIQLYAYASAGSSWTSVNFELLYVLLLINMPVSLYWHASKPLVAPPEQAVSSSELIKCWITNSTASTIDLMPNWMLPSWRFRPANLACNISVTADLLSCSNPGKRLWSISQALWQGVFLQRLLKVSKWWIS